jgi:hypothetical protein
MLRLLEDIAVDTDDLIGIDNPLRQVIINTHSPAVVAQVKDNTLLVAELKEDIRSNRRFKKVCFSCLSDTWRAKVPGASIVSKGKLLSYLNPVGPEESEDKSDISVKDRKASRGSTPKKRRVADREDLRQLRIPFSGNAPE